MFAVIDCGTTNTTIFILSDDSELIAQGTKKSVVEHIIPVLGKH